MTFNRTVACITLVLLASSALAGGRSGAGKIEQTYQRSSDGLLAVHKVGGDWDNPDSCDASDRIVITRDNESRAEFYSAILAALMAGREIDAWLNGCVDWSGTTYPNISGLYNY